MRKTFYLCDGNVEDCPKTECYKKGGECRHTVNVQNAKNPIGKRTFTKDAYDDYWENQGKESSVLLTNMEKRFLVLCIHMAAKEGYYMVNETADPEIECWQDIVTILEKLGADQNVIDKILFG